MYHVVHNTCIVCGRNIKTHFLDLIVLVFGNTIQTHDRTGPVVNCDKSHGPNKRSQGMFNVLTNVGPCAVKRPIFASRSFVVCV